MVDTEVGGVDVVVVAAVVGVVEGATVVLGAVVVCPGGGAVVDDELDGAAGAVVVEAGGAVVAGAVLTAKVGDTEVTTSGRVLGTLVVETIEVEVGPSTPAVETGRRGAPTGAVEVVEVDATGSEASVVAPGSTRASAVGAEVSGAASAAVSDPASA